MDPSPRSPHRSRIEFFSRLTPDQYQTMAPYLRDEVFDQGDAIIREGQRVDRMFFLVAGLVHREKIVDILVEVSGSQGWQEKECHEERRPGQHFCEEALMESVTATADWVAVENCRLASLSGDDFKRLLATEPELGLLVLKKLCLSLSRRCLFHEEKQAGLFEHRLLVREMRTEKKKIQAMHRIASSTAASDVKLTLDTILTACMDCLDVAKGSIMIFDKGVLRVEAAFGRNRDKILGQVQVISDKSISGRCFLTEKPVFIEDIEQEQGVERAPDPSQYMNNSLISYPLISFARERIGVLNVSKTTSEVFTERDLLILHDLAREASAALGHEIELARLYRNFQETCLAVRKSRQDLGRLEEDILATMDTSWPAREAKDDPGRLGGAAVGGRHTARGGK